ncbi:uroporphyrinogen-III synthase-like [Lutzomyia longipalpis]|uniref:uroporphyrinogen-III synthase-like n=1 Tax=Lutzomyia longipalpis TaxID=7200 RepID=UPI0024841CDE|nr:uroporphyrinogen-III synthase-like [Lutzomyia longipalpis]
MKNLVIFKLASDENSQQEILQKYAENGILATFITPLVFAFKNLKEWGAVLQGEKENFLGIIFTSPRSVEASLEALSHGNSLHSSWHTAHNYCVGPTTSQLVSSKLGLQCQGEDSGNAEVLSAYILEDMASKGFTKGTFLFPCGNLKLGILERKLQEGGFFVQPFEIYETICNPELEDDFEKNFPKEAEYLLFYSPSCVAFSLPILRKRRENVEKLKFIAIGPSTKKSIEDAGIEVFRACEKPTLEHVLKELS